MIHSEKGNVQLQGKTEELIDDLTMAIASVLSIAKCRDKKHRMNVCVNISNNAIDILIEQERKKENDKV